MEPLADSQVPPDGVAVSVVVEPADTIAVPEIIPATGIGLTVSIRATPALPHILVTL
jgi:hypothetical protein